MRLRVVSARQQQRCSRCGLLSRDDMCEVCQWEIAGLPMLTWDMDALVRFAAAVLAEEPETEEAA